MNPVNIIITGLKCDAAGCDYRDDSINRDQYQQYIDRPCPKCGASLLTPADFAATELIFAIAAHMNATEPPSPEGSGRVHIPILFDGSGFVELGEPRETEASQ